MLLFVLLLLVSAIVLLVFLLVLVSAIVMVLLVLVVLLVVIIVFVCCVGCLCASQMRSSICSCISVQAGQFVLFEACPPSWMSMLQQLNVSSRSWI